MSDEAIKHMSEFIRAHHPKIISFREAKKIISPWPLVPPVLRSATSTALRLRRAVRG
jgi:hypothetical protein